MAKRKLDPLITRWENLADSIRNGKGNFDFGDIDPTRTADEQRDENPQAVKVEELISDLRSLASELGTYFDIYLEDEINSSVEKALGDKDTFQKMVALLIKEGKLEHGDLSMFEQSADEEETVEGEDDYDEEAELAAMIAAEEEEAAELAKEEQEESYESQY